MKDFNTKKVGRILYGLEANHANRLGVFFNSYEGFTDKEFWYGLSHAYSGTDNLYQYKEFLEIVLWENEERPFREYFMSKSERNYFKKLPKMITIYRGMTVAEFESGDFGLSWTLSKKVAEFFAYIYLPNVLEHFLA